MNMAQIKKATVPFELAAKIREILNQAKKSYGSAWEDDEVENKVIDLLCDE